MDSSLDIAQKQFLIDNIALFENNDINNAIKLLIKAYEANEDSYHSYSRSFLRDIFDFLAGEDGLYNDVSDETCNLIAKYSDTNNEIYISQWTNLKVLNNDRITKFRFCIVRSGNGIKEINCPNVDTIRVIDYIFEDEDMIYCVVKFPNLICRPGERFKFFDPGKKYWPSGLYIETNSVAKNAIINNLKYRYKFEQEELEKAKSHIKVV